jgi:hypothetical protein
LNKKRSKKIQGCERKGLKSSFLAGRKKTRLIIVYYANPEWLKQFFLPNAGQEGEF